MPTKEEIVAALESLGVPAEANDDIVPSGQRKCPICQQVMKVEQHSGVAIDVCAAHGMWLDNGELMELLSRTERSVLTEEALNRARSEGQMSEALLHGWGALAELKGRRFFTT